MNASSRLSLIERASGTCPLLDREQASPGKCESRDQTDSRCLFVCARACSVICVGLFYLMCIAQSLFSARIVDISLAFITTDHSCIRSILRSGPRRRENLHNAFIRISLSKHFRELPAHVPWKSAADYKHIEQLLRCRRSIARRRRQ